MKTFDVAIIGGGAAGLACAVRLTELNKNLSVVIVEAGNRLGKKIAATGNGQGNVANADAPHGHYHGSCAALAEEICGRTDALSLFDFLTVTDKSGRIYPAGKQASAVSDCLIKKVRKGGVTVLTDAPCVKLSDKLEITLKDGEVIKSSRVLLAAGGKAQKQFMTDGSAYALAVGLGHSVTPLYPSLVQLKCTGGFKALKGIRADCRVTVKDGQGKPSAVTCGDVIFTDYGLSGNAVFYASAYCSGEKNVSLSLEFLPGVPAEKIVSVIAERKNNGYERSELLGGTLHNALGREIIKRCNSSRPEDIVFLVKNFPVAVEGALGWDYAQVTKGGIPRNEIGGDLESKFVKGLYFAGEVLDADGDCGGYNLSFAFASGIYAAECINSSIVGGQRRND